MIGLRTTIAISLLASFLVVLFGTQALAGEVSDHG
jgi:hypothetical protein